MIVNCQLSAKAKWSLQKMQTVVQRFAARSNYSKVCLKYKRKSFVHFGFRSILRSTLTHISGRPCLAYQWKSSTRQFREGFKKRKCLNVHSVCTNFCLNVHGVCINLCLNVHSPCLLCSLFEYGKGMYKFFSAQMYAGLRNLLQPCSRAARKWRENEEMDRE